MEVLPKHFEASAEGTSYFTLILKNLGVQPKQVEIRGLEADTVVGHIGQQYLMRAELDRREVEAPPNEICSVKVKISCCKDAILGLRGQAMSQQEQATGEHRLEGSLIVGHGNEVIRVRIGVSSTIQRNYVLRDAETRKKLIYQKDEAKETVGRHRLFGPKHEFGTQHEKELRAQNLFKSAKSLTQIPQRMMDASDLLEDQNKGKSDVLANLEELMASKIKETESDFEESESSFMEFKRKLETGRLKNLKMVSSFEPTGDYTEREQGNTEDQIHVLGIHRNESNFVKEKPSTMIQPVEDSHSRTGVDQEVLLECYQKLMQGNESMEVKLQALGRLLQKKDRLIRNMGAFAIYLERKANEDSQSQRLLDHLECLLQEGVLRNDPGKRYGRFSRTENLGQEEIDIAQGNHIGIDSLRQNYYGFKLKEEERIRKKEKKRQMDGVTGAREEILGLHMGYVEEFDLGKEEVRMGKEVYDVSEIFREPFGFFRALADPADGGSLLGSGIGTNRGQIAGFLHTEMNKIKTHNNKMQNLEKEISKWKSKTQKSQKLISFLNENNEKLEEELQEAMTRELELTGQMQKLVMTSSGDKGLGKKTQKLEQEVLRLKNNLMGSKREATELRRKREEEMEQKEGLEEEVDRLREEIERMRDREGRLEKLKEMVEEVDVGGEGEWQKDLGQGQVRLEKDLSEVRNEKQEIWKERERLEMLVSRVLSVDFGKQLNSGIQEMSKKIRNLKVC